MLQFRTKDLEMVAKDWTRAHPRAKVDVLNDLYMNTVRMRVTDTGTDRFSFMEFDRDDISLKSVGRNLVTKLELMWDEMANMDYESCLGDVYFHTLDLKDYRYSVKRMTYMGRRIVDHVMVVCFKADDWDKLAPRMQVLDPWMSIESDRMLCNVLTLHGDKAEAIDCVMEYIDDQRKKHKDYADTLAKSYMEIDRVFKHGEHTDAK